VRRASARQASSSSDEDRQARLQAHHEDEEEARGEEVQGEGREVARDRLGHALVQVHARGDLARGALRVERHRQRERLGEEAPRRDARRAPEGVHQEARLDRHQEGASCGRDHEADDEWHREAVHVRHQHLVHETPEEPRDREAGEHEGEAHRDGPGDGGTEAFEVLRERAQHRGRGAAGLEVGALLEGEHHAGEGLVELGRGVAAAAARGIVKEDAPGARALHHDEMVEVHERDRRQRQLGELARLLAEAARNQAVRTRRAQQPARLAAVAAHAAVHAHLLQGHVAPMEGEHHRERGGAALDAFELQDGGRAPHRRIRWRRGRGARCSRLAHRVDRSHAANAATRASNTASATRSVRG
jgi:hypothetical protein